MTSAVSVADTLDELASPAYVTGLPNVWTSAADTTEIPDEVTSPDDIMEISGEDTSSTAALARTAAAVFTGDVRETAGEVEPLVDAKESPDAARSPLDATDDPDEVTYPSGSWKKS